MEYSPRQLLIELRMIELEILAACVQTIERFDRIAELGVGRGQTFISVAITRN